MATAQSSIVDYQAVQYCDNSLHLWLQITDFAFTCQDITLGLQQTADDLDVALLKLEFHQVVSVGILSK
ncbi:hypothetical protein [Pseudochrobactrum sp. XF203]|uniref:hypothetical protein n=1 Tax=Pseudochrobactrum sp. XF203 TaxID=2879116 RepID=UPI001CE38105|nr:hypothetical protein [Pseudochrobactrum sp. XF203]UCA44928.1 hypothetical protein LDL70_11210 [Pseudochrobactrum sp. XF203]